MKAGHFLPRKLANVACLCVLLCLAGTLAAAKKKPPKVPADYTPLMAAALNCDLDTVTTLLQQGADLKAVDSIGDDALTVASSQRILDKKRGYLLKCPGVVSALVKAGANPGEATFYQSPEFEQHPPTKIAVLRVDDYREEKSDSAKVLKEFTAGVE